MSRSLPRVSVTTRPNPSFAGAVLLDFAEDCPYCGKRHHHGSASAQPANGTYGHRVAHCGDDNPGYILIPEGGRHEATT